MKYIIILIVITSCSSQYKKYHTGIIHQETLLGDSKWLRAYQKYELSDVVEVNDTFNFTIIFGLWCHDSKREIPRLLKTLDMLSVPKENINLIAIDKKKTTPIDSIKKYKIHFTPTIVVNYNGKEVERFVEYPHSKWESDIIKLYQKYAKENR